MARSGQHRAECPPPNPEALPEVVERATRLTQPFRNTELLPPPVVIKLRIQHLAKLTTTKIIQMCQLADEMP